MDPQNVHALCQLPIDVVCLLAAGNCVVKTAAGRGERGKFFCNFVANDQYGAESQILDAHVALQRHRFGLNSCRILSRGCSNFTAFTLCY